MRVSASLLPRYEPENPAETCPKCSSLDVRVGHQERRFRVVSMDAYRDAEGSPFVVEDEHLRITCTRCHYRWPRRCHDMEAQP